MQEATAHPNQILPFHATIGAYTCQLAAFMPSLPSRSPQLFVLGTPSRLPDSYWDSWRKNTLSRSRLSPGNSG